jgi:hypothetical protein
MKKDIIALIALPFVVFSALALMPAEGGEVVYPTNTTYFVAYGPDGTAHVGVIETNQVMSTGQPDLFVSTNALELAEEGSHVGFTNWPTMPEIGEEVTRGVYLYSNEVVAVYQDHTRQADWAIDSTPALYGIYRGTGTAPVAWVQPLGAQDAYNTGDRVLFEGQTWESVLDANVWSPTTYPAGWKKVE